MGAIADNERAQVRASSPVGGKYDTAIDRDSAAEKLAAKADVKTERADAPQAKTRDEDERDEPGMAAAQPYGPEALIERIQLLRDTIGERS